MKHPSKIKAVLFDMDGVLIDSERKWQQLAPQFLNDIGVSEIPENVHKQTYGISMEEEYSILKKEVGLKISYEDFVNTYDNYAMQVYSTVNIAKDLEKTLNIIKSKKIHIGLVTSSLKSWAVLFLRRLKNPDIFDYVLSIADTTDLKPKPAPDGYIYTMNMMKVKPEDCIAIEDSNRGIKSSKNAGIYTFASREFVDPNYIQEGYDMEIPQLNKILDFINNSI